MTLLKHNKSSTEHRCPNPLYKKASLEALDQAGAEGNEAKEKSAEDLPKVQAEDAKAERKSIGDEDNQQKLQGERNGNEPEPEEAKTVDSGEKEEKKSRLSCSPATGAKRKRGLEARMVEAIKRLKTDDSDEEISRKVSVESTPEDLPPKEEEPCHLQLNENVLVEIFPVEAHFHNCHENENWNSVENWNRFEQENAECHQSDNWVNPYGPPEEMYNPPSTVWDNWDPVKVDAPVPAEVLYDEIHPDEPYYMTGFPNPPAENRCWLNATLQTIFALPLIEHLSRVGIERCSILTRTLVALQVFWKGGSSNRAKMYQTVDRFKKHLEILDESYSSFRQQDVSEFLMKLLNYVKSDCEKAIKEMKSADETENTQNMKIIPRSPTPSRRLPLTQISPFKNINGSNDSADRELEASSPKSQESCEEPTQSIRNPIDEFFLLPMMEHYVCQSCNKHRQRKVDNMMVYVDLPENETDTIDLAQAISKTLGPEERTLTCAKCKCEKHRLYTSFRGRPKVLIVQINRYGMSDGYVAKMNSTVHIPEELEIRSDEE